MSPDTVSCTGEQVPCGEVCVDPDTDPLHCGGCGIACSDQDDCVEGVCTKTCAAGETRCGTACVDTDSDPTHCGACGTACGDQEECVDRVCANACAAGETRCGTACVDTGSDPAHCGACGSACEAGWVCNAGVCDCPPELTRCDGTCVDLSSSADHCGACGTSCLGLPDAVAGTCNAGVCVPECAEHRADCNGELADGCELETRSDRWNCGGCGVTCGALCGEGTCLSVELPSKIFHHVCARHGDGRVSCWGLNMHGQLGTGNTNNSSLPLLLPLNQVAEIATGENHSCARTMDGLAWCWGRNDRGQLGTGDALPYSQPQQVMDGAVPLSGVEELALTDASTCARLTNGVVKCWGSGQHGRLGNGNTQDSLVPVTALEGMAELQGATGLAAGTAHVCARMSDGTVRCWGRNNNGQLGMGDSGSSTDRSSPAQIPALTGVDQVVAAGFRTCARSGGSAKCWGQNLSGQVGDGTTVQKTSPVDVLGLTTAAQLMIAPNHGCALLSDATARCWGLNNVGQLGDGSTTNSSSPVTVLAPGATTAWTGLKDIGAGGAHTCVVAGDDSVRCWGMNNYGQLGDGNTSNAAQPVNVIW